MTMTTRKKPCPKCGQNLWLRDFYLKKDGSRSTYCKCCSRQMKREEYARNRKKPDGIFFDQRMGRAVEHRGSSVRIHWSEPMLHYLRTHFATAKNEDIAIHLGVSLRTMIRKARELGLQKSPSLMHHYSMTHCRTMQLINKFHRNSGMFQPGQHACPEHEFKKKIQL